MIICQRHLDQLRCHEFGAKRHGINDRLSSWLLVSLFICICCEYVTHFCFHSPTPVASMINCIAFWGCVWILSAISCCCHIKYIHILAFYCPYEVIFVPSCDSSNQARTFLPLMLQAHSERSSWLGRNTLRNKYIYIYICINICISTDIWAPSLFVRD